MASELDSALTTAVDALTVAACEFLQRATALVAHVVIVTSHSQALGWVRSCAGPYAQALDDVICDRRVSVISSPLVSCATRVSE